jgi:hypothetical protein
MTKAMLRDICARTHSGFARGLAVAIAGAMMACGGRTLSSSTEGASVEDSASAPDEDAASFPSDDASLFPDEDVPPLDANAVSDADGVASDSSSDAVFSSACASYASVSGRASCDSCISRATGRAECGAAWNTLETQCGPQYLCVVTHCICRSPCNTADLCSCAAGCLPVHASRCTKLWAEAMQCVGSFCAGGC